MTAPYEMRFCPNCATALTMASALEDGGPKERLRCPACAWTHWGNPTPVLAAVIENDRGEVLMARNALWEEGSFGLITGFMEAGESPEAGVCREVFEETGLRAKVLRFLGAWEFLRMNQVMIAYHIRAEGEVILSPELVEYRWQSAADVTCWPGGGGYALAHWVTSKGYTPTFRGFRPGHDPNPDPAKWPPRPWSEDPRFEIAPQI
ncbi:NUDIX hydrolase [Paracoccus aminophilus]|uniref:NUDIX hydrolase n=1 Tax=Paracoccus aminophilus JCM 7686 TaxID=1367847 RepID=S5XUE3_PARAH|nr:NUDIX hydrolase [Paracoccus aminophilus]AGT11099.1 NUDIX hydrolase [Paracoccus aminophilus JCM 7686]